MRLPLPTPSCGWTGYLRECGGIEHLHDCGIIKTYRDSSTVRGESSEKGSFSALKLLRLKQLQPFVFDRV